MKFIAFIFTLLLMGSAQAGQPLTAQIGMEVWASPRQANTFLQHEGVSTLVQTLMKDPEARLRLRYPADEWGEIWGQELRIWLVSLGISSDRIELNNDYSEGNGVALELDAPQPEPQPAQAQGEVGDSAGQSTGQEAGEQDAPEQQEELTMPQQTADPRAVNTQE